MTTTLNIGEQNWNYHEVLSDDAESSPNRDTTNGINNQKLSCICLIFSMLSATFAVYNSTLEADEDNHLSCSSTCISLAVISGVTAASSLFLCVVGEMEGR